MRRVPLILVALLSAAGIVALIWPHPAPSSDQPLTCYVGGTMKPVFDALCKAYEAKSSQRVDITTADSGELLATIEMNPTGDLYVAHDPFMDIAMARGLGANAWCLGEIYPVIVVPKGNPKDIQSLKDFFRPDVKVYLTDYEHSTMGHLLPIIFKRAGLDFEELNRIKNIPTHRSGSWVANQIIMKSADAALVWQAVAYLRRKDLDAIQITDDLPQPGIDVVSSATGKYYPAAPVKVNIVSLISSKRQNKADQFVTFIISDAGKTIFEQYGFKVSNIYGTRAYANGVRGVIPDA